MAVLVERLEFVEDDVAAAVLGRLFVHEFHFDVQGVADVYRCQVAQLLHRHEGDDIVQKSGLLHQPDAARHSHHAGHQAPFPSLGPGVFIGQEDGQGVGRDMAELGLFFFSDRFGK